MILPHGVQEEKCMSTVLSDAFSRFDTRIAIEDMNRSLTYGQLEEKAAALSLGLTDLGMPSKRVVGIYMDGTIDYVVAVLAALKADMIFMPLNTVFPGGRLEAVCQKTRPAVLVTDLKNNKDLQSKVKGFEPASTSMSRNHGMFLYTSKEGYANAPSREDFSDAGYIISTSGSTGEPKAILGSQRGLAHFVQWEQEEFGLDETARISFLSSVTFDVSLRDIFVPLAVGGRICIPGADALQNPSELLHYMRARGVTVTHMVPTLFRMMTKAVADWGGGEHTLPELEYILLAGEPFYGADIDNWRQAAGSRAHIVNLYGPSETTLAKLFYRVGSEKTAPGDIVPIGKPIPDTEVMIINEGRRCAPNEPGEIYIKTPFMSKGYYGDDALTKRQFVQNPLNPETTDIVYKTGDRGELTRNGIIRILGRLDGQVKLYGRRIELGEVEAFLGQHPDVFQVAAALHQKTNANPRLVGYIVLRDNRFPGVENLRRFLLSKLPDYMVPHVFVRLSALPLTHNGKVDRSALPEPGRERPEMEIPYVSPVTDRERVLCAIWSEVLELDRIGIQDNFFDLGGTSVLAAVVVAKIQEALQTDLPVARFFQLPTVALLAEHLQGGGHAGKLSPGLEERARRRRAAASSKNR